MISKKKKKGPHVTDGSTLADILATDSDNSAPDRYSTPHLPGYPAPVFRFHARILGLVEWSCPYCCFYNKSRFGTPNTFRAICGNHVCQAKLGFGVNAVTFAHGGAGRDKGRVTLPVDRYPKAYARYMEGSEEVAYGEVGKVKALIDGEWIEIEMGEEIAVADMYSRYARFDHNRNFRGGEINHLNHGLMSESEAYGMIEEGSGERSEIEGMMDMREASKTYYSLIERLGGGKIGLRKLEALMSGSQISVDREQTQRDIQEEVILEGSRKRKRIAGRGKRRVAIKGVRKPGKSPKPGRWLKKEKSKEKSK